MVRTTIACAKCRRSKTKCVHDGVPPCRSCLKGGRTEPGECILSGPFDHNHENSRKRSRHTSNEPALDLDSTASGAMQYEMSPPRALTAGTLRDSGGIPSIPTSLLEDVLKYIPIRILLRIIKVFSQKFPEISFIHIPTISTRINKADFSGMEGVLAAILALCQRLLPNSHEGQVQDLLPAEEYIVLVKNEVTMKLLKPPTLETVQTLLVLSMYNWGSGKGYQAWMYSGMAIRMMQSLEALDKDDNASPTTLEIKNRTYWSCFIMDRMISCGVTQPPTLPLSSMRIPLPIGEQDFAFGSAQSRYTLEDIQAKIPGSEVHQTSDFYFSVLIRGFDIWSSVLTLVIGGGRRRPGMAKSKNSPWVPGSPWNVIYEDLKTWRNVQSERLKYSANFVAAQVSLGNGESMAYINLIYYLSMLFLCREYIPFIPSPETTPRGPIDPPLLEAVAPENWWKDNSRNLFDAAAQISSLLTELENSNARLMTPFTGFCAFSAATMNLYVSCFPNMNLRRSPEASSCAKAGIAYLDSFRKIWGMGEGWFETIQHTSNFYRRASSNRAEFQGKTREDFIELEASIHDATGASPAQERNLGIHPRVEAVKVTDHAAAISLQELASGMNPQFQDGHPQATEGHNIVTTHDDPWAQIWPLWGDDQLMPFAVGGLPFDYNLDFITGRNTGLDS